MISLKLFSTLLGLIIALSMLSSIHSQSTFYKCEAGKDIDGYPGFRDDSSIYFPFALTLSNDKSVVYTRIEKANHRWDAQCFVSSDNGILRFDFGQSDQYNFVQFSLKFEEFLKGDKQTVQGFFEDGFDWSNGYNTRARFEMTCSKLTEDPRPKKLNFLS